MEVKLVVVFLFWTSVIQRVSSLEERFESDHDAEDVDFERLENEYAVGNISVVTEVYENTTMQEIPAISTEIPETKAYNATEFRPSWHLGEIEELQQSAYSNPFNKLSHLKFDNSLSVQPKAENWQTNVMSSTKERVNALNKHGVNTNINLTPPEQNPRQNPHFFPPSIGNENPYFRIRNHGASFNHAPPSFETQNVISNGFQNSVQLQPSLQRPEFPINSPEKMYFETTYVQEVPQPFDRPVSFHEEGNFVTPFTDIQNFDYVKPPGFVNYQEAINNVKVLHPEMQEILPTRNQRFPYKFYHENPGFMDNGNFEYVADEQVFHNVVRERRISPWKKIIHLLGTILPFGLLLATLTPNVVQISNSTQSTIPLSKFKDVNLPPEHKGLRMDDDRTNCEEKMICEVILAGSKPKSNLLQNILWNFVVRTPEKTAKDNGLRELFQAVKKRDCNLITC